MLHINSWGIQSLIDTIQVGNFKRKRFFLCPGGIWIEGIGSLEEFYPPFAATLGDEGRGINYQKKGSEIVYKTDEWYFNEDDCNHNDIRAVLVSFPFKLIQRKGEIELQPDANGFESGRVCVYSMQGELLYTKPVQRNANILIPTSGFSNGFYVVQLINEKTKKLWSRKVVIYEEENG